MSVPSRKNRMMQNIIKNQESKKRENFKEMSLEEVSDEEPGTEKRFSPVVCISETQPIKSEPIMAPRYNSMRICLLPLMAHSRGHK